MARTYAELIARARTYADQVGSPLVSATEAGEMLNAAWGELYGLLVSTFEDYFIDSVDIAVVVGTEEYNLPDGDPDPIIFKVRSADWQLGSGDFIPMKRFQWSERGRMTSPESAGTVRLQYVPVCPKMVSAAPVFDQIIALPDEVKPSWDDFVAIEMALQMLAKEQNESSYLIDKKERKIREILSMAPVRDADEAPRMVRRTAWMDEDEADLPRAGHWGRDSFGPSELRYCLKGSKIVFRSNGEA